MTKKNTKIIKIVHGIKATRKQVQKLTGIELYVLDKELKKLEKELKKYNQKIMALKTTKRITIIDKQKYAIQDVNGKDHEGYIYEGFDVDNRIIRFTSQKETYTVVDGAEYEEKNARDIVLYGRTDLNGRVKWSDEEKIKKDMTQPRTQNPGSF